LTSGHSDAQGWASECPDVKNYKSRLNPVWHKMLYSCTHMEMETAVGIKGLTFSKWPWWSQNQKFNSLIKTFNCYWFLSAPVIMITVEGSRHITWCSSSVISQPVRRYKTAHRLQSLQITMISGTSGTVERTRPAKKQHLDQCKYLTLIDVMF